MYTCTFCLSLIIGLGVGLTFGFWFGVIFFLASQLLCLHICAGIDEIEFFDDDFY